MAKLLKLQETPRATREVKRAVAEGRIALRITSPAALLIHYTYPEKRHSSIAYFLHMGFQEINNSIEHVLHSVCQEYGRREVK
ncbi:hypothetical protein M408DRAFT_296023 [Serendipita vermifera MAFF 305830]|uniref:Uncharacterized protein n=1 Tax=Serendipita vermifera MAFF 305830 TaxID=933852 RepID=A0A0C2WVS8_SERVB|nr:hypothetical protein M408DRAFT_296023 [Serendipita vermifera MAFF 305830]